MKEFDAFSTLLDAALDAEKSTTPATPHSPDEQFNPLAESSNISEYDDLPTTPYDGISEFYVTQHESSDSSTDAIEQSEELQHNCAAHTNATPETPDNGLLLSFDYALLEESLSNTLRAAETENTTATKAAHYSLIEENNHLKKENRKLKEDLAAIHRLLSHHKKQNDLLGPLLESVSIISKIETPIAKRPRSEDSHGYARFNKFARTATPSENDTPSLTNSPSPN